MKNRKKPEADLRSYYTVLLQTGMIIALLAFIVAVKVELTTSPPPEYAAEVQEVIELDDIVRTEQIETPPPPPRPPSPVSVPNDEVVEAVDLNINADLDFGQTMDLPPPPPQEEEEDEPAFFVSVEQQPELIGGLASLQRQTRYPDVARRANIEGTVIVQFVVNTEGEVENPQVIRGVHAALDQEALRVISQARFVPGRQQGRPVPVQYSVPVVFQLTS